MTTTFARVCLNVGGRRFETTLETLTRNKNTMLARMFSGDAPMARADADGSYFFDRDGYAIARSPRALCALGSRSHAPKNE